jgi:hypothetical protein
MKSLVSTYVTPQNLFLLSILSIFFTNTYIYPIIFFVFIMSVIMTNYKEGNLTRSFEKWQFFLILFLFWALIITIANFGDSSLKNTIKLFINLSFLLIIPLFTRVCSDERFITRLFKVIELIILLNFIQLLIIYFKLDIFSLILENGINSSMVAYVVTSSPEIIFIGSVSKNIWATKVGLIGIIYLYGVASKIYRINLSRATIFISISFLSILMGLGRTAQLAYAISIAFFLLKKLYEIKDPRSKLYLGSGVIIGSILIAPKVIDKIFHINFNLNDGGYIRLKYWYVFLTNFMNEHFIIGNGILSASEFLKKYSTDIYLGENNLHNVWLNTLLDWGLIGFIFYILFFIYFHFINVKKDYVLNYIFLLFIPLNVILGLQYLGYDNDIVVFLSVLYIIHNLNFNR